MLVVAYGMGVNSKAMLCGFAERGIRPDVILSADTGGEKPETLLDMLGTQRWLESVGFPSIFLVSNDGMYKTLENNCLQTHTLPSLAYGWKSCSDKYKRRPQEKFLNHYQPAVEVWQQGGKVLKAIGYDAGEERRAKIYDDARYTYWYPLIEWQWGREECVNAIRRAHLPIPPKSACFFCPASTKKEVLALAHEHPELLARALTIEENASETLQTVKGLGRRWAWKDLIKADADQLPLFANPPAMACGCFDGADEEE
jgi:hypothetical protein